MNSPTKTELPNTRETAEYLIGQSILLSAEVKALLLREIKGGMDEEALSSIITLLKEEKPRILDFIQHALKTEKLSMDAFQMGEKS